MSFYQNQFPQLIHELDRNRLLANMRERLLPWFSARIDKLTLLCLMTFSGFLRFWRIDQPDKFVFDEVYFPVHARNYLQGTRFFDSHPPLGKYLIAIGIRFFGFNPLGYRVMAALAGILVILLIYQLGKRLFNSRPVAFLAALFASLDGLLLVESRAGLINIFAVLFSLAAYSLFLKSGEEIVEKPRWLYLAGAGVCVGAAAAVKWIGVASFGVILVCYVATLVNRKWSWRARLLAPSANMRRISNIHPSVILLCCIILPIALYCSTFVIHLNQNPQFPFVELHKQMFGYHAHLKDGHGYASPWWSWPLLLRPVNYYWEVDPGTHQVRTILNLGNPILWWLALPAMMFSLWSAFFRREFGAQFALLVMAVHYLPFALISRATFLYHFMGALPFAIILTASAFHKLWLLQGWRRETAAGAILAIILAAIYFYPIWTALPIPVGAFYQRMWLTSWI